jgi:hypothetical protein
MMVLCDQCRSATPWCFPDRRVWQFGPPVCGFPPASPVLVRRSGSAIVPVEAHSGIPECWVMEKGPVSPSVEGTPQGDPLRITFVTLSRLSPNMKRCDAAGVPRRDIERIAE